jgi:hypothetical protein
MKGGGLALYNLIQPTISLEMNSFQSNTKLSEVNVKDTFTSHIDKNVFLTFLLTPYLYAFST